METKMVNGPTIIKTVQSMVEKNIETIILQRQSLLSD